MKQNQIKIPTEKELISRNKQFTKESKAERKIIFNKLGLTLETAEKQIAENDAKILAKKNKK